VSNLILFPVRKYTALAALLSVFYLAIGAYALHPHFHGHSHHQAPHSSGLHSCTHHYSLHIAHQQEKAHREGYYFCADAQLQQQPCPLCNFLSNTKLLTSSVKKQFSGSASVGQTPPFYQSVIGLAPSYSSPVRGPPLLSC
jgi:hypothetical protein